MTYLPTETVPQQTRPAEPAFVPTYLVAAVLSTVFCFVPTGVAALVYAGQVKAFLAVGDVAAAQRASRNAKRLCWVSLSITVMFLLVIVVGADGYSSNH